ncbi:MAG: hypothetical protein H6607_02060 [Flavobacteriales bacterium]|nr:hypothetical protein [Flavobacteriales bacterium]
MQLSIIIFLIAVGLLLLLVEILVTPGVMLGIVGLGFIAYGVYSTYQVYGNSVGSITLFVVGLITIGSVLFALKSGVWSRMASKEKIEARALEDMTLLAKVGDTGKSLSMIRPMGTALLNGKKIEVSSLGEVIDSGAELEVLRVEQNKIFVKQI